MKSIFHVYIFKHYKFKCNNENEARELSKIRNPGHEGQDGLEVFNIKIKRK